MVEAGAVSHLEGVRQRGTAALTRVPRTAAQFAMREGMAAGMDAHGAAKLMAQTGPPGTGGEAEAGADAGAGSDNAGGLYRFTPDAAWIQENLFGGPREKGPIPLLKKPVYKGEGGSDGSGDAGSGAGPGGAPGGGGSGGGSGLGPQPGQVPADWTPIGQPRPHDRRYFGGRDHMGGVIHGLPPLQPRPDHPSSDGPADGSGPK
jgi:hypothetical protein